MKILTLFIFSFLSPEDSLLQLAYDSSSFVGLVKFTFDQDNNYHAETIQGWKNDSNFTLYVYFTADERFTPEDGKVYLIFSSIGSKPLSEIKLSRYIDPIEKSDLPSTMITFLNQQPCIKKRPPPKPGLTGACLRSSSGEICGCNGKPYSSPCEAGNDGVMQYTVGRCP